MPCLFLVFCEQFCKFRFSFENLIGKNFLIATFYADNRLCTHRKHYFITRICRRDLVKPSQLCPSTENPGLQLHLNDPGLFLQTPPVILHLWVF